MRRNAQRQRYTYAGNKRLGNRRRRSGFGFLRTAALIAALSIAAAGLLDPERFLSTLNEFSNSAQTPPPRPIAMVGMVRPMPLCGSGRRISCVVDGDTFWVGGEKVRLQGVDAPEINGACAYERDLAQKATRRLSDILSSQQFSLHRTGADRYGRTLATVETSLGEAGDVLVREGLARPWRGRKEQWCG